MNRRAALRAYIYVWIIQSGVCVYIGVELQMMYEREQPHADGLDWLSLVSRRNRARKLQRATVRKENNWCMYMSICDSIMYVVLFSSDSRRWCNAFFLLRDSGEQQLPAAHLIDIPVVAVFIHIKGQLLLFYFFFWPWYIIAYNSCLTFFQSMKRARENLICKFLFFALQCNRRIDRKRL